MYIYFAGSADFLGLNLYTAYLVTIAEHTDMLTGIAKDTAAKFSVDSSWKKYAYMIFCNWLI